MAAAAAEYSLVIYIPRRRLATFSRGVPFTNGRQPTSAGRQGQPTRLSMRPQPLGRRSDGVHRAAAIPWTKARATRRRQVSWLMGHRLIYGLPRPRRISVRPSGWRKGVNAVRTCISRSPLTVAGTAAELGHLRSPHRIPFSSPLPGNRRDLHPSRTHRIRSGQGSLYFQISLCKVRSTGFGHARSHRRRPFASGGDEAPFIAPGAPDLLCPAHGGAHAVCREERRFGPFIRQFRWQVVESGAADGG